MKIIFYLFFTYIFCAIIVVKNCTAWTYLDLLTSQKKKFIFLPENSICWFCFLISSHYEEFVFICEPPIVDFSRCFLKNCCTYFQVLKSHSIQLDNNLRWLELEEKCHNFRLHFSLKFWIYFKNSKTFWKILALIHVD